MNKASMRLLDHAHRNVGVRIWGAALLIFAIAAVVAWSYLPPPLPNVVRLGTGPLDGDYARFGETLRKEVAEHGINLELVATAGSMENIRLLLDGKIDVGLVQSESALLDHQLIGREKIRGIESGLHPLGYSDGYLFFGATLPDNLPHLFDQLIHRLGHSRFPSV